MNALAALPAADDANPVKSRPISKRMQKALSLIATRGMTQRDAAKQAGMSECYLSTALKKPQVQVFIERAARQTISLGLLRASNRTVELIDASSEHVSLDASKHVLAIAGIKPTADAQVSVNIDIKAGYVIDLTDSAKPVTDTPLTRGPVIGHE
jgi:pantoate kinase